MYSIILLHPIALDLLVLFTPVGPLGCDTGSNVASIGPLLSKFGVIVVVGARWRWWPLAPLVLLLAEVICQERVLAGRVDRCMGEVT